MKNIVKMCAGLFLTVFLLCPAFATAPRLVSFQGQLTDSLGVRLTGTYSMTFKLYNVSSGGSALWTEAQSSVSVTNGVFDVELGIVTALGLPFDTQYWLGITVSGDAEMTPRRRLMSSPYALYADTAAFLAGSAQASGSFTVAETATLSGKVGVGTSTPGAKLHVTGNVIISDTLTVKDTVFVVKDNGNVGIGTTNPGRHLTVANSGADVFIQVNNSSVGGRKWNMRSSGTGSTKKQGSFSIEDENVGATRLLIDTNGYVGIGTDTPVTALQVAGTIRADTFEKPDGTTLGGSGGGDLRFPDGTTGMTVVFSTVDTTTTYTVPGGKTLYITQVYATTSVGVALQATVGATTYTLLDVGGNGGGGWNYANFSSGSSNVRAYSNLTLAQPIILPAGTIVKTGSGVTFTIHGFLVATGVTPVLESVTSSATYTVPTGKTLYIMQIYDLGSFTTLDITIGANTYTLGQASGSGGGWNHTDGSSATTDRAVSNLTLALPIFVPAAGVVKSGTTSAITINGYVK